MRSMLARWARSSSFVRTLPITPNVATVLSVVAGGCAGVLMLAGEWGFALAFAVLAFALDAADGMLARARGQETRFGAYLDGVADRITEFFILSPLMFAPWPDGLPAQQAVLVFLAFGTFMTSFAKAYADHRGAVPKEMLDAMGCVLERAPRAVLILLAVALYPHYRTYSFAVVALGAVLSVASFAQRFAFVYSVGR